jgi:hypothetical protein
MLAPTVCRKPTQGSGGQADVQGVSFEGFGPVAPVVPSPVVPRFGGISGPARPVSAGGPSFSETFAAALASTKAPTAAPAAAAAPLPAAPAAAAPAAPPVAGPPAAAAAPATPVAAGSYPNLTGDLDASPEVLSRLNRMAAARGERWTVTSGLRTDAEQAELWANRASNPYPVARPGTSIHRTGQGADVTIGGRPIQDVIPAGTLRAAGLEPLVGDAVHVQLAGTLR